MIGNYAENSDDQHRCRLAQHPGCRAGLQETNVRSAMTTAAARCPRTLADETGVSFWQPAIGDRRLNTSRHIVFNLSRAREIARPAGPARPRRQEAGSLPRPEDRQAAPVFSSTSDPDYQKLLAMCVAGSSTWNASRGLTCPVSVLARLDSRTETI